MRSEVVEKMLADIEAKMSEVVSRREFSSAIGHLVAVRTLANLDALGKGVGVKIRIGRSSVGYPKQAVMNWIKKNLTINESH